MTEPTSSDALLEEELARVERGERTADQRGRLDRVGDRGEGEDGRRAPRRSSGPAAVGPAVTTAERPLAAAEQPGPVVAGVVLDQPAEVGDDRAVPSTASSPSTWARVSPWRSTWRPPALVATVPPTVAESRLPRSTP